MKQAFIIVCAYAVALAVALSLTGCASMFAAKTTLHYEKKPDGSVIADWESGKEQIGLDADALTGKIKVDKSGTQEAVIAASLATQVELLKLMQQLVPLVAKGAGGGGIP